MKNTIIRLLSALLTLCMVAGVFTTLFLDTAVVSFADEVETGEGEETEEEEGFKAQDLLTTPYASVEDKLRTMSVATDTGTFDQYGNPVYEYAPYKTYGDYELYVQEVTGEVALKNTKTGQVMFTNPYDACLSLQGESSSSRNSKLPLMFSQLVVKYEVISEAKATEMNSFNDAACYNQIEVSHIKNGICVEYTIGRADERRLVPVWMEKYRFEKIILSKITGEYEYKKMQAYYSNHIFMNSEEGELDPKVRKQMEGQYPVLKEYGDEAGRKIYYSEDYDELLEAEYAARRAAGEIAVPYKGYFSMYVYGNAKNKEMNDIEAWIRAYVPEYSYDMLEYDHELTKYKANNKALPSFKMALEYRLDDDGLSVRLPANSISFDEDTLRLLSIDILPYMGAGSDEHPGYVFVPDGSGSIIRFEDFADTPIVFSTGTMYGPDNAYHTLPVNYSGHEEKMRVGVYGIVETGKRTYEKDEEGNLSEVCPHRFVEKVIEADCVKKTNGGSYTYCEICGELKEIKAFAPYVHEWTARTEIQKKDCHHYYTFDGTCKKCQNEYNKQLAKYTSLGYTVEQIDEMFGELKQYKGYVDVAGGYADHQFDDDHYVCIDGECYMYYQCSTKYELTDEDGNVVLDDEGNPVMVQCEEIQKGGVFGENGLVLTEHDYDPDSVKVYAEGGHCYKEMTCMQCNYSAKIVDDHDFGDAEATVKYDTVNHVCYEERVCTICNTAVKTPIEHEMGDAVYTNENGLCKATVTCKHCGYSEVSYEKHSAGTMTEKYDTTKHLCLKEGVCENCNTTFTVEINHTMTDGKCSKCGFTVPTEAGHTYDVSYVNVGGTCYRTFVCTDDGCGKEYGNGSMRTAVAHSFGNMEHTGALCTPEIHYFYTCENCGYEAGKSVYVNEEVAEHSYKWVNEGLDSTTDKCLHGYTSKLVCEECGDVKETKQVVGHVYGNAVRYTENVYSYTCTVCGHVHYGEAPEEPDTDSVPEADEVIVITGNEGEGESEEEPESNIVEVPVSYGFFAVMTEGASLASLSAASGGVRDKYLRAYMTVTPRPQDSYNLRDSISTGADAVWTVVSERKYTESYTIRFYMLQTVDEEAAAGTGLGSTESTATYAGMANEYRKYLAKNGALTDLKQSGEDIPLYLEAFGAIDVSTTFLTMPTTEQKALTTFEDLQTIIGELQGEDGKISNINVRLTGFANGGMIPNMPYKLKFEKAVGGNDGFTDFVSFAKKNNVGVYPDFDFAYMHNDSAFDGYSSDDHAVKTIDDRYIVKKDYNSTLQIFTNTGLLAVSASVYDYFYEKFNENYKEFNNAGISVSTMGTDINSDFDKEDPYNRADCQLYTEKFLEKLKNDYGSVMIDGGNAYAIGYAEHILNMSLEGSTYLQTSSSVPFLAMVLHGSVNYAGTATNMASSMNQEMLHIIENGASPFFIIAAQNTNYLKEHRTLSKYYSLDYSTWKNDMIEAYTELNSVLKDVKYAKFIDHGYVSGIRVPDADEVTADCKAAIAAIGEAIKKYNNAVSRVANAEGLIERKTVTEPAAYEAQIEAILAKYAWAVDAANEKSEVALSKEDQNAISALFAKIANAKAIGTDSKIVANLATAQAALDTETKAFNDVMARYGILFNVSEEDRMTPAAYTAATYNGNVYEKDGKYYTPADGSVDSDGNPIATGYEINDSSIVKVAYDNGVEIYINYNYYDVVVAIGGENVLIEAYGYYKTTKGEA